MWFISHVSSGETLCFSPEKLKYTVGRANADLELQEDICISRAHAVFHLIHNKEQSHMELEDVGSKYGTFYNKDIEKNTPLEKGHKKVLKENDLIRFGRLQNVWKVHRMNINTVTSALSKVDALQVEKYIKAIGGKILDQWSSSCTHLTMKDPSVTMKLLHALLDLKFIVTPDYWKDLFNVVIKHKSQLPKPELYSPCFDEDDIDVSIKPERRFLFEGTTFVFLNRKHFDMYMPIVKAAGGASKDLNSGVQKSFMIKNKVVVVQYTPSTQTQSTQTINSIAEYLESHSKRIIPEYEIGLAILHCSIEKFCNPCFKITQTMSLTVPNESADISVNIDLTEEQDTIPNNTATMDLEIPETNEFMVTNQNLVSSTQYSEQPKLNTKNSKGEESMPDMCITETPAQYNQQKRKHNKVNTHDLDESDDEDLFQFQSKKHCQTKKDDKEPTDKTIQKETGKSTRQNHLEVEKPTTSKAKLTQNVVFSNFLEKTQKQFKNISEKPLNESEKSTSTTTRKRPHIQVLDENDDGNDDEDLFSFGDTQKPKKTRGHEENQNIHNEEDLFGFKEKDKSKNNKQIKTVEIEDEDSNDLVATQQFLVADKSTKSTKSVQMPKPKILPRKVSATDWLTDSLCKIKIKNENIKDEENFIKSETTIKHENDLNISEDHRKWLESLNGAIQIHTFSLNNTITTPNEKSHYVFKNRSNHNMSENLDGTSKKNFKTFVKQYVPSSQNASIKKHHLR